MRTLFWLGAGFALGAFGYRYYDQNGGRLPLLEQWTGRSTEDMAREARGLASDANDAVQSARRQAEDALGESAANVARESVVAVAEEITEAEHAKRRERSRTRRPTHE